MRIFDAHIHADVRSFEDFQKMSLMGVRAVLVCAHNSVNFTSLSSLTDHFDSLLDRQCKRMAANRIIPLVALGIHPRGIPGADWEEAVKLLPEYLTREKVVAVGEIGLDLGGSLEEKVLYQQLLIAKELNKPCLIHTPGPGKKDKIEIILRLVERARIDKSLVLIDHLRRDVLAKVKEEGFYLGLSAHPSKLDPVEIAGLIKDFGAEKIIVSSDIGNSLADIGALPKVIAELKLRQISPNDIEKVVFHNARKFLRVDF